MKLLMSGEFINQTNVKIKLMQLITLITIRLKHAIFQYREGSLACFCITNQCTLAKLVTSQ